MPSVEELARMNHGAIQVEKATRKPFMAVLAGPIAFWWEEGQWDTPLHDEYIKWRDAVESHYVRKGWLVYSPHKALRGAWWEGAQAINDAAIRQADALVVLTPPGVPAHGTAKEIELATHLRKVIIEAPPGDPYMLANMEKYHD